jgi:hypothetical protein
MKNNSERPVRVEFYIFEIPPITVIQGVVLSYFTTHNLIMDTVAKLSSIRLRPLSPAPHVNR